MRRAAERARRGDARRPSRERADRPKKRSTASVSWATRAPPARRRRSLYRGRAPARRAVHAVHIVLRLRQRSGRLFTDLGRGACLRSSSARPSRVPSSRRGSATDTPSMLRALRLAGSARRPRARRGRARRLHRAGPDPHRRRHRHRHEHDLGHRQARPRPAHRGRPDAVHPAQQRAARAQRPLRVRPRQHPHAPTSPRAACRTARSPPRRATRGSGAPCPS